ncbi:nuclear transport factor 2 family protein [Streptomyces sp. NPDC056534]|uniref:nuclear transport factor 2 family protein n=1 Tax=Streptomyces sp. NPDC056534 TaxID=3345857 RepID=UPI0036B495C6
MNTAPKPIDVVERQLTAYNDHDLDGFADAYAEDVRITYPDGNMLEGRQAVRQAYAGLFTEGRCHAETTGRLTEGDWVVDHETAHGISPGPLRVLVAYRVRDGHIDRAVFLG